MIDRLLCTYPLTVYYWLIVAMGMLWLQHGV